MKYAYNYDSFVQYVQSNYAARRLVKRIVKAFPEAPKTTSFQMFIHLMVMEGYDTQTGPDFDGHTTKFGITKATWDASSFSRAPFRILTPTLAYQFYMHEYAYVGILPGSRVSPELGFRMFQWSVVSRKSLAVRKLQYCLNALSRDITLLKEDGIYGGNTIRRLVMIGSDPQKLAALEYAYMGEQLHFFTVLANKRETRVGRYGYKKYIAGWLNNRGMRYSRHA